MHTIWSPANNVPTCHLERAPLDQCSPASLAFLSLVTQLFGSVSYSISYTGARICPSNTELPSGVTFSQNPLMPSNSASNGYSENIPLMSMLPLNNFPNGQDYSYPNSFLDLNNFGQSSYIDSINRPPPSSFNVFNTPFFYPQTNDYRERTIEISPTENKETIETESLENEYETNVKIEEEIGTESRSRHHDSHNQEYDFIIVGGGSAGCVLANRLSEIIEWNILLLEAGPEEPDVTMVPAFPPILRGSSIDWNYQTQPEPLMCKGYENEVCSWPSGKTMGGTSAINYMVYIRGNKLDYDDWAEMGNTEWSYNKVLPYFIKSENNRNIEGEDKIYHGVGGPLNVERFPYTDINTEMILKAFEQGGLPRKDLTLPDNFGTNIAQSTSKDGRRFSANLAYIRPIRNIRPNLYIITNAYVTKIIIDPNSKIAHGITFYKDGMYHNVYARKEVIISGGSLNSPKLLMLSGVGPKQHLENLNIPVVSDLQVGQNLQDHATSEGLVLAFSNKTSTEINAMELINEVINYRQQDVFNSGPLSTTGTVNAMAFIKTRYATADAPDIQFNFIYKNVKQFFADPSTYVSTFNLPFSLSSGVTIMPILLTPKSRGQILLNQTDPVFGAPLIYPGFFTEKVDLDTLVEGMRFALTLEHTEAFQSNGARIDRTPIRGCENYVWGSYDYFVCLIIKYTSIIFHSVGTCKMGPRWDGTAVVDPRLRVYGIRKLRVIDASVMPKAIRGNTNAPTIMIGEKASDMIKEDWSVI